MEQSEQKLEMPKIKQPPVLFNKTQVLLAKIAASLGGAILTYWNGRHGGVSQNDVLAMYETLEKIGRQETIYLFIKSDGGNGQASLRLVNLLRQYCSRLIALVPLECASAATMIALGADEILMGPMAFLTSVDTSLTRTTCPRSIATTSELRSASTSSPASSACGAPNRRIPGRTRTRHCISMCIHW